MISLSLGLLAALSWSVHDLLARRFAAEAGPYRLAFWVIVTGALLTLFPVLWRGQLWHAAPPSIAIALAMGVVYAMAVASLLLAFSLAPVSVVGPLTAGYPALVVVWGLLHGLVPTAWQWLALLAILVGAVMVGRFGPPDGGLSLVPKGKIRTVITACLVASLCFATTIIMGQWATQNLGATETTFLSRFPAAFCLLGFMRHDQQHLKPMATASWFGAVVMGSVDVVAVTAVNAISYFPNKELGSMGISAYGALSALLAMLLFKEKVTFLQVIGIGLIVVGIGLLG